MAVKNVLIAGIDPDLVDFSMPGLPPGLNAAKLHAELKNTEADLTGMGYAVEICFTDLGETGAAVVAERLKQKRFDCVMIGGGIRLPPPNLQFFERVINAVHEGAPQAKICFNASATDMTAAVTRWV